MHATLLYESRTSYIYESRTNYVYGSRTMYTRHYIYGSQTNYAHESLKHTATHCNTLQNTLQQHCNTLQHNISRYRDVSPTGNGTSSRPTLAPPYINMCCRVLQCVAVCCGMLQCVAACCSVLQCVAVCCSVLQCVAERICKLSPTGNSTSSCPTWAPPYQYTIYSILQHNIPFSSTQYAPFFNTTYNIPHSS